MFNWLFNRKKKNSKKQNERVSRRSTLANTYGTPKDDRSGVDVLTAAVVLDTMMQESEPDSTSRVYSSGSSYSSGSNSGGGSSYSDSSSSSDSGGSDSGGGD